MRAGGMRAVPDPVLGAVVVQLFGEDFGKRKDGDRITENVKTAIDAWDETNAKLEPTSADSSTLLAATAPPSLERRLARLDETPDWRRTDVSAGRGL